ncbi:translesion DNA synthesis-associated protein ImuA [Ramlibacter sp.]|uniref:translesion DNA synthesis-associated protein ImuA n=1 Tax=Ramlibacter sp. TaxID=1917967 RepID=UPI003D0CCF44
MWRGTDLAGSPEPTVSTGRQELDGVLPGGGWPVGAMVELLNDRPAMHAWQLLLPGLCAVTRAQPGPVVLVGAPFEPFCPALMAQGLAADRLLRIEAEKHAARLWASEQALRCADVPAVLAWLPRTRSSDLRRMQLAAHQHQKLLFVFRPLAAMNESSPARLRLVVEGTDRLQLRVIKRRGAPLARTLELPARPLRLEALLASRKGRAIPTVPTPRDRSHVLDRAAALA